MAASHLSIGPSKTRLAHYLLLLAAGLVLFINNLGAPTLWDLDEGRNATAALEMMTSGDYVVPTFNYRLRVDKPVLLYWLQIASFRAFGVNEFAARLPSALAALGTLFCCYELGRSLFCPSTALLGALILASSVLLTGAGHFANPDALLVFSTLLVLTLFWRGQKRDEEPGTGGDVETGRRGEGRTGERGCRPHASWFVSMGAVLGLAALAKGPVGVCLPVLVMTVHLAWEKRLQLLCDRRALYGVLALLAVALPWYVWVTVLSRGSFLRGFLLEHNVGRFVSPTNNHNGWPFYYLIVLLVGLAPWSFFALNVALHGIVSVVRAVRWQGSRQRTCRRRLALVALAARLAGANSAHRFLAVWLGCYLLFFSLAATKLPNYILPAVAPCTLLIGRFLDRWRLGEIEPPRWVMAASLASVAGVGLATGLALVVLSKMMPSEAAWPADTAAAPRLLSLSVLGAALVAAALAAFWFWRRGERGRVVGSVVVGQVLFLAPLSAWALPAWNVIKAPRALARQAAASVPDAFGRSRDIRIGGFNIEHLPSLNFYTRRPTVHQGNEDEALAFLRYELPVYLFLPARAWHDLKDRAPAGCTLLAHHADLYRASDIVVVTNGKQ
jgi:4-amino-4-deoxy-L-arabinose transferase-like glycosyltransferase